MIEDREVTPEDIENERQRRMIKREFDRRRQLKQEQSENQPQEQSEFGQWFGWPQQGPVQNLKENLGTIRDFPYKQAGLKGLESFVSGATAGFLPRTPWVNPEDQSEAMKGSELIGKNLGRLTLGRIAGPFGAAALRFAGHEPKDIPYKLSKSYLGEEQAPRSPEAPLPRLMAPPPESPPPPMSENIRQALANTITEGRNLSQTRRAAAKEIYHAGERERGISRENYENFFGSPNMGGSEIEPNLGKIDLLPSKPGELGLGKRTLFKPSELEHLDSKSREAYKNFDKNTIIRNAHDLQSQMGNEIGKLKYREKTTGLDGADRKRLFETTKMWLKVNGLIDRRLEGTPYEGEWQRIKKFHRENVQPFNEGGLREISTGEVKNPGNLVTIIRNREIPVARVLRKLGPGFKSKILHMELGELGERFNPLELETKLHEKGLGGILTNEQNALLEQYRHHHGIEQAHESAYERALRDYELASKEGVKKLELDKKAQKELHNALMKEFKENREKRSEKTKRTLGAVGILAGALMKNPFASAELGAAGYLAKPLLDKLAQAIVASRDKKGF